MKRSKEAFRVADTGRGICTQSNDNLGICRVGRVYITPDEIVVCWDSRWRAVARSHAEFFRYVMRGWYVIIP